jgi:hypothetical protein
MQSPFGMLTARMMRISVLIHGRTWAQLEAAAFSVILEALHTLLCHAWKDLPKHLAGTQTSPGQFLHAQLLCPLALHLHQHHFCPALYDLCITLTHLGQICS